MQNLEDFWAVGFFFLYIFLQILTFFLVESRAHPQIINSQLTVGIFHTGVLKPQRIYLVHRLYPVSHLHSFVLLWIPWKDKSIYIKHKILRPSYIGKSATDDNLLGSCPPTLVRVSSTRQSAADADMEDPTADTWTIRLEDGSLRCSAWKGTMFSGPQVALEEREGKQVQSSSSVL